MALRMPRLLPMTILAMAALLGVKSVALVRAAAPTVAGASTSAPVSAPMSAPLPLEPPPTQSPPAPMPSPAEQRLLQDLARRSAALDARAAALDLRETVLK
ncbi:MAG TPA: hypothetical protein VMA86_01365, partial [Acetobacteraceae bacterium]|nr:hypothetical protein [Acetobacteraceae bacterium]